MFFFFTQNLFAQLSVNMKDHNHYLFCNKVEWLFLISYFIPFVLHVEYRTLSITGHAGSFPIPKCPNGDLGEASSWPESPPIPKPKHT